MEIRPPAPATAPICVRGTALRIPGVNVARPEHRGLRLQARSLARRHRTPAHALGIGAAYVVLAGGASLAAGEGALAPLPAAAIVALTTVLAVRAIFWLHRHSWSGVLDVEMTDEALHIDGRAVPRSRFRDFTILRTYCTDEGGGERGDDWAVIGYTAGEESRVIGHLPLHAARCVVRGFNEVVGLTRPFGRVTACYPLSGSSATLRSFP